MEKYGSTKDVNFISNPMGRYGSNSFCFSNEVTVQTVIPGVHKKILDFHASRDQNDELSVFKVVCYTPSAESALKEPILFIQGFMVTPLDYERTLATIAKAENRQVIGWDDIAGIPLNHTPLSFDLRQCNLANTSEPQLSKVIAFTELMDQLNIEYADVIAHSEGCIHTLLLETIRRRFRSMILIAPAGLVNNKSILRFCFACLQEGFFRKIWDGKYGTPGDYVATGYKLHGGLPRRLSLTLKSILGVTKRGNAAYKLLEGIINTKNNDTKTEPKITVIAAERDHLFRAKELRRVMTKTTIRNDIKFFIIKDVDHPGILLNTEVAIQNILPYLTK